MKRTEIKQEVILKELLEFDGKLLVDFDPINLLTKVRKVLYREGSEFVTSSPIEIKWESLSDSDGELLKELMKRDTKVHDWKWTEFTASMANVLRAELDHKVRESFLIEPGDIFIDDSEEPISREDCFYAVKVRVNRFAKFETYNRAKDLLLEELLKEFFGEADPYEFLMVYYTLPSVEVCVTDCETILTLYVEGVPVKTDLSQRLVKGDEGVCWLEPIDKND